MSQARKVTQINETSTETIMVILYGLNTKFKLIYVFKKQINMEQV